MKRREEEVEFKNKLYRHHKSKFSFVVRNFSLTFIGIFTVLGGIVIPTYISTLDTTNVVMKAEENDEVENSENTVEESHENEEEEVLMSYLGE